jgi:hypothetical protein
LEEQTTQQTISTQEPSSQATKPGTSVLGIPEWVRTPSGELKSIQLRYAVTSDEAGFLARKFAHAEYNRDPWNSMPLPTGHAVYGTTRDLFTTIKTYIAEQTHLSDKDSALLTLWVFSTWFHDVLSMAPGLVITGSAHDGDGVLRAIYPYCYHPVLVAGLSGAALSEIKWDMKPALLIFEPNLSRRLAALLCSSTRRGYLALRTIPGASKFAFDYYGPKAIYAGEDPPIRAMLEHCVHINASPAPGPVMQHVTRISEESTQRIQNQLLRYRAVHLPEVSKLELSAATFSPDFNAIASALGECIVDAPDLQEELVSLLAPYSEQQIAERIDDLGTLAVRAALALCHQGKDQIRVAEIAAEVNRVQKDNGEKLHFSPEKVGHRLRRAGLLTRRLGAGGNGFAMDHSTRVKLHDIAIAYGCVGSKDNKENLHCQICEQIK